MTPAATAHAVVAAGAVLWRQEAGPRELALVHRPRYDDWSLPKGKLHRTESAMAAAVREVTEETGFVAFLGHRLGETHYRVPEGDKIVHYWAARTGGGHFQPNDEVDELRWLGADEARALLTYEHDRAVLDRFTALPSLPRPLLLVRHAKAGNRADWDQDDDLRPLSGKGRRQADELGDLLSLFGPTRLYAAPPVRCSETIQPLADTLGVTIAPVPRLSEDGYWDDPDAGIQRLQMLADEPGTPVVCSQGGVIPDLIGQLTDIPDPPARKASTWVLGFADGKVVTADYYGEPAG
jgi:8-oxo-dGTP diphosphatase